jgi:hypothetical protein
VVDPVVDVEAGGVGMVSTGAGGTGGGISWGTTIGAGTGGGGGVTGGVGVARFASGRAIMVT